MTSDGKTKYRPGFFSAIRAKNSYTRTVMGDSSFETIAALLFSCISPRSISGIQKVGS
jgi:hypothetical protein